MRSQCTRIVSSQTKQLVDAVREYFNEVRKRYLQGDYTEGTFRTPLENFLKKLNPQCDFIQEPDRVTKLGAPDFKVLRSGVKMGYVETKELGKNLDKELSGPQIAKYKENVNNIIFTDYARFILIRNNQVVFDINLFSIPELSHSTLPTLENRMENFMRMDDSFVTYYLPTIDSGEELARELSKKAKLLRDLAEQQLDADAKAVEDVSTLFDFYRSMQELINDITVHDCADEYAQTITYGLFLAKMNGKGPLSRENAAGAIPHSIGIIKKIFTSIASELPDNLTWIIDEIVEVLNASDMPKVLSEIDTRGKKDRDPLTFFYEDFLQEYDPEKRKHLGVYYTPRPVISFIVNSVNSILKSDFDKKHGFADDNVTVLDPAVGTGTFLWLVYLLTLGELKEHRLSGLIPSKIENHVLKDFYGFEVMITPYIFAHLKLASILKRWFYEFKEDDRVQVFLTNTLEPSETHGLIPYLRELNEESRKANEIKQKKILAIVSNPPYSGESFNKGKWITVLMKSGYTAKDGRKDDGYYKVDRKPLGEKNPKWIGNDYVKFIRFAQWKIDSAGEGVIGFITDNSYLDNPTFGGVRQSLINSFDRIYILNLHGHFRKDRNPTTAGGDDENVFDIGQGVAIAIFVKNGKHQKSIMYADLWGSREHKFQWLDRNVLDSVKWKGVTPKAPYYLFIPTESKPNETYMASPKIPDIFPMNSVGIVTARDDLSIRWSKDEVWKTVTDFVGLDEADARSKYKLGKDTRDWKVSLAQKDLRESGPSKENIVPILYRPFDTRYSYFTGRSRGFLCMPRQEVMIHMKHENVSLLFNRREALPGPCTDFLATEMMAELKCCSRYDRCYQAPLYRYENGKKKPNVDQALLERLGSTYNTVVAPEDVFYYTYAACYSPTYRVRYDTELRQDYPRIPFTPDSKTFRRMVGYGEQLVELHLKKVNLRPKTQFDVQGSNIVEKVEYTEGRIAINGHQYFAPVPNEIWEFYIGGYQVLDKWLKSRKGRALHGSDVEEFLRIIEIIRETLGIMKQIDEVPFLPRETKR